MVTEINNFICSQCGEPIKHADFKTSLGKVEGGKVVLLCPQCIGSSTPAVMLTVVKSRIGG